MTKKQLIKEITQKALIDFRGKLYDKIVKDESLLHRYNCWCYEKGQSMVIPCKYEFGNRLGTFTSYNCAVIPPLKQPKKNQKLEDLDVISFYLEYMADEFNLNLEQSK